jgi:hypothetical protein
MANRLIRYDAALLRRFLADGFRGPGDALLLLLVAGIAVAWLRQEVLGLAPGAAWFALLAGPAGFAWQMLARLRLAGLAEQSAVAPAALERVQRRAWFGLAHLLASLPLLAAAILLGIAAGRPLSAIGLAAAAYALGAGLASVLSVPPWRFASTRTKPSVAPMGSGRRAVIAIVLARQTSGARRPFVRAGLLLLASLMLTLGAGWCARSLAEPARFALPLLPALAVLLLAGRLDSGLLAFLPSAGFRPAFIALAVSALPLASLASTTIALLLVAADPAALIVMALAHLAFILVAISRAWLYPGRTARSVDLQLQLEFCGLAVAAILLPPLAVIAALWRLRHFHNHCRAKRWMSA